MRRINLLVRVSAVAFAVHPASAEQRVDLVIRNITVIDPVDGMRAGQDVLISGASKIDC